MARQGPGGYWAGAGSGGSGAPPLTGNSSTAAGRQLEQWLSFAFDQEARTAPHPAPATLEAGPIASHCLSLSRLDALPLAAPSSGHATHVRLGVTLFDQAAGCFLGTTARSEPAPFNTQHSKGCACWVEGGGRTCRISSGGVFAGVGRNSGRLRGRQAQQLARRPCI